VIYLKLWLILQKVLKLSKKGYGANLYNYNKLNKDKHKNRTAWLFSKLYNIYNMDFNFIKKAESILSFISFCLVMKQLKKDPFYEVNLPIYIDATCSGIQHIAAMIKDLDLAKNLIPQLQKDKVSDIYTSILDIVNKKFKEIGTKKIVIIQSLNT